MEQLLDVQGLKKYFPITKGFMGKVRGHVKAVDDVSLNVVKGETLGLVGESGCGKSTLGRTVARAYEPTEGKILFTMSNGETKDIALFTAKELKNLRKEIQMIFQDPYSSLDPRMTVKNIVGEPLKSNKMAKGSELEDRVKTLLEYVGLETRHLNRFPHAFSGGQRQRLGIARALALNPRLILADEPVSALDVSIQAQILNLLQELQKEFDLTYVFVAHDLSVIRHISDRVAVMYVGKIVEQAETEVLFDHPLHPYTEALLSASPEPDPEHKMERIILSGEVANPADPPPGCLFHPRCRYVKDICRLEAPLWEEAEEGHFVRCHRAQELSLKGSL